MHDMLEVKRTDVKSEIEHILKVLILCTTIVSLPDLSPLFSFYGKAYFNDNSYRGNGGAVNNVGGSMK